MPATKKKTGAKAKARATRVRAPRKPDIDAGRKSD